MVDNFVYMLHCTLQISEIELRVSRSTCASEVVAVNG